MKRKNDKEAKTSKRKRIKWNSGTICKETKKKLRSVFTFFKSIPREVKRNEKNVYFISLRRETKQKNVYLVSLLSETKKSEAKWSETKNFWKQDKAKIRCINFALVGSEKFKQKEAKWSEKKNFCVSVQNACKTDFVSLRFA
jgi:hypothetical protein